MQHNNYNIGLPPASKDQDKWGIISEVLDRNEGRDRVTPEHIRYATDIFMEWLQIRRSSSLFRLTSEKDIIERVSFHNTGKNQQTGLIVMQLDDEGFDVNLDKQFDRIIVAFNANTSTQTATFENAQSYRLHPVQAGGSDRQLRNGTIAGANGFTVPALSVAVFVR